MSTSGIYGSLASTVGVKNPYRYRGYRYDTETGLYYNQSRYYSPDWGRFINADALAGTPGELLSSNVFAYCKNNPVNMSDQDGFCENRILPDEEDSCGAEPDLGEISPAGDNASEGNVNETGNTLACGDEIVNYDDECKYEKTKIEWPSSPHTNGTEGHWETIVRTVEEISNTGDYTKIYVNKGLRNEIPDAEINRRPDIMAVREDGIIDQFEVPSKTDDPENLIERMEDNQRMMGERAGSIRIVPIED